MTLILEGYKKIGKLFPGDDVIVPANCFTGTILCLRQAELNPIIVDVDPETFNISIQAVKDNLTPSTRAIVVEHIYGGSADMTALHDVIKEQEVLVIEDASQAQGAYSRSKRVGNCGDVACFSFFAGKNLDCLGDAGAVTTNDAELYNVIKDFDAVGLDEFQASVLRIKLDTLDKDNQARAKIAQRYLDGIHNTHITLPTMKIGSEHVWHLFVIRVRKRDELQHFLHENGVQTIIPSPIIHNKSDNCSKWPITDELYWTSLALPINPVLTVHEQDHIINLLNSFCS